MYFLMFVFPLSCVLCWNQENYDYVSPGYVVANIKRRDSIPLHSDSRKWISNGKSLNYRRTKDIRQDRHFEITEAQLREAQREAQIRNSQINEMRENEIKSDHLRSGNIRNGMQLRENPMINTEMRDNQFTYNYNQRNSQYGDEKDHLDKLQREMRWLTIDTDEGIGIGV